MAAVQNYQIEKTGSTLCTSVLAKGAILSSENPETGYEPPIRGIENDISSFVDEVISIAADKPDWLVVVEHGLQKLKTLPSNWDSYGSPPIFDELIDDAECFLRGLEMQNIVPPFVAPLPDGGVHLEWHYSKRELEVEFSNKGNVEYLKVLNGEPIEEGKFKVNDYNKGRQLINWLLS